MTYKNIQTSVEPIVNTMAKKPIQIIPYIRSIQQYDHANP